MAEATTTKTPVSQSELNNILDDFGGAGNVVTTEKKNIFSKPGDPLSDLDATVVTEQKTPEQLAAEAEERKKKDEIEKKGSEIIEQLENELNGGEEVEGSADDSKSVAGRPKVDKSLAIEVMKELFEKKTLLPFDEDKKPEDYTKKDLIELIETNFEERGKKFQEEIQKQFFENLSPTLQWLAKYEFEGGENIKEVLQGMLTVEETRELNPEEEKDQEIIVRNWLRFTNFGTPEEIEEEITSMKDRAGALEEKAKKWKPKLDAKSKERLAKQIEEQELLKQQYQDAAEKYEQSIVDTLKPGELNGLKIDQKTQSLIYNGLVSAQYPSRSGRPTNLLGHLLEKYNYVEPDHKRIAEVVWLLADRDSFIAKLREQGKTEANVETRRKLKEEEANRGGSSVQTENEDTTKKPKQTVKRKNNFFART